MDSPFQPTIYLNSKQPSEDIDRKAKLLAPSFRIMGSGPCTSFLVAGNVKVPCPCPHGVSTIQLGATFHGNEDCQACTHPLSAHKDFNPALDMSQSQSLDPATTDKPSPVISVSPILSPRNDTVAALWELVQRTQVLHVRGTPASGKTVLAGLLQQHVRNTSPNVQVYLFTWNPAHFSSKGLDIGSEYDELLNCATKQPKPLGDWRNVQNTLLLIDEAQLSYKYNGLWNNFIKYICGARYGPLVVLFSSYGSPSDSPIPRDPELTPTPVEFGDEQRVSIRPLYRNNPNISLYFTPAEFDEVVARICGLYANQQPFNPSPELIEHIWELCNGHPGGTVTILEALIHSEELQLYRKTNSEISLNAALEFLNNDEKFFACLLNSPQGFKRSLPKIEVLQEYPDLAQCLRKVIAFHRSKEPLKKKDESLKSCFKNGWLQAELSAEGKTVYIFPTNLHQRYAEIVLRTMAAPFPEDRFSSIKDLCSAVVREFSPVAIRSRREFAAGALERPVEAQFQDEFYRACYTLLGDIYFTSEWSGKGLGGSVDFQIKSQKWAIECVREGDRLEQHIERFLEGGRYYKWVESGEIEDYIILDFRTSTPRKVRDNIPFLYFIVFSKDYTCYETYDAQLNLVEKKRALTN